MCRFTTRDTTPTRLHRLASNCSLSPHPPLWCTGTRHEIRPQPRLVCNCSTAHTPIVVRRTTRDKTPTRPHRFASNYSLSALSLFLYRHTTRDPPTTSPRLHLLSPHSYRSARHEIKHQPVPIASPTTALSPHPSLLHTTRPAHNLASSAPAQLRIPL